MFLRLCACVLLSCALPAMASSGFGPEEEDTSPSLTALFQMAQKEMPLPVLKVVTWPASGGRRHIAIEMSTAGLAWAKKPVMNVLFQAKDETLQDLEEALRAASAATKEVIEAAASDAAKGSGGVSGATRFWRRKDGDRRSRPAQ